VDDADDFAFFVDDGKMRKAGTIKFVEREWAESFVFFHKGHLVFSYHQIADLADWEAHDCGNFVFVLFGQDFWRGLFDEVDKFFFCRGDFCCFLFWFTKRLELWIKPFCKFFHQLWEIHAIIIASKGVYMNKSTGIILAVFVLLFGGFATWAIVHNQSKSTTSYDVNTVIEANEDNGMIAEHIEGDQNAPVKIFEYSDYQCSGCASVVDSVAELVKKYDGKVAVVHRTYVLSYHTNGIAAASASEAAGLQGYWKQYGDYLFDNQADWYYSDATARTEQFAQYFLTVSENKGDVEKFLSDMASENVKKKVNFDISLAKQASAVSEIQYTPAFFLDGEFVNWAYENPDNLSFVDYMSKVLAGKGIVPAE